MHLSGFLCDSLVSISAAGLAMARSCDVRRRIALLQRSVFSAALNRRTAVYTMSIGLASLALLVGLRFALAEPASAEKDKNQAASTLSENDPRRNLRFTLAADKEEFFLGENVVLHYRIKNGGHDTFCIGWEEKNSPFCINFGGDSRNDAGRAMRFKVEVLGQDGRKAEDPYPNPSAFGGIMGGPDAQAGRRIL